MSLSRLGMWDLAGEACSSAVFTHMHAWLRREAFGSVWCMEWRWGVFGIRWNC